MVRSQVNLDVKRTGRQPSTPKNRGKRPQGVEKHQSQKSIPTGARSKDALRQWEKTITRITSRSTHFPLPQQQATVPVESSSVLPTAVNSRKWTQTPSANSEPGGIEQPYFQHGHGSIEKLDRKRKRLQDAEDLTPQVQGGHIEKRARISLPGNATGSNEGASDIKIENKSPIDCWRKTGNWPKKLFEPDPNMNQQLTKKRSSSGISYSQGVKEGEHPLAYTPDYEKKVLAPAGIIMDQQQGEATISNDDKRLCITLVQVQYEPPENSLFADDIFVDVMNSIHSENEPRVVRDIGSYITPSAEHLQLRDASRVKYLKETIQAEWTQCVSIVEPRPRPHFTVRFSSSAFSCNETKKLEYYRAPQNPTEFARNLYFPFLTCECDVNELDYADRQNIRNASTAVNPILQLYRGGDESRQDPGFVSRAHQLHRKILVFSISHDHSTVKIYGHYALTKDKTTFHRHLIHHFGLTAYGGQNRWTAYNFVRSLYDNFAPIHLKRIQDAISLLPEKFKPLMSTTSAENESEVADSQELATGTPSSLGGRKFKKPQLPKAAMLQKEVDRLLAERDQEREESKRQHTELMEQIKELTDMLKQRLS